MMRSTSNKPVHTTHGCGGQGRAGDAEDEAEVADDNNDEFAAHVADESAAADERALALIEADWFSPIDLRPANGAFFDALPDLAELVRADDGRS